MTEKEWVSYFESINGRKPTNQEVMQAFENGEFLKNNFLKKVTILILIILVFLGLSKLFFVYQKLNNYENYVKLFVSQIKESQFDSALENLDYLYEMVDSKSDKNSLKQDIDYLRKDIELLKRRKNGTELKGEDFLYSILNNEMSGTLYFGWYYQEETVLQQIYDSYSENINKELQSQIKEFLRGTTYYLGDGYYTLNENGSINGDKYIKVSKDYIVSFPSGYATIGRIEVDETSPRIVTIYLIDSSGKEVYTWQIWDLEFNHTTGTIDTVISITGKHRIAVFRDIYTIFHKDY